MGVKLIAIRTDERGKITHFLTNQDEVISFEEAQKMAKDGRLDSIQELSESGIWTVKDSAGTDRCVEGENMSILPHF